MTIIFALLIITSFGCLADMRLETFHALSFKHSAREASEIGPAGNRLPRHIKFLRNLSKEAVVFAHGEIMLSPKYRTFLLHLKDIPLSPKTITTALIQLDGSRKLVGRQQAAALIVLIPDKMDANDQSRFSILEHALWSGSWYRLNVRIAIIETDLAEKISHNPFAGSWQIVEATKKKVITKQTDPQLFPALGIHLSISPNTSMPSVLMSTSLDTSSIFPAEILSRIGSHFITSQLGGVAAIHEILKNRASNPANFSSEFLITTQGGGSFIGTQRWVRQQRSLGALSFIRFALCIESLFENTNTLENPDLLYVHATTTTDSSSNILEDVIKTLQDVATHHNIKIEVLRSQRGSGGIAASLRQTVLQHEHEVFAKRSIPALTISSTKLSKRKHATSFPELLDPPFTDSPLLARRVAFVLDAYQTIARLVLENEAFVLQNNAIRNVNVQSMLNTVSAQIQSQSSGTVSKNNSIGRITHIVMSKIWGLLQKERFDSFEGRFVAKQLSDDMDETKSSFDMVGRLIYEASPTKLEPVTVSIVYGMSFIYDILLMMLSIIYIGLWGIYFFEYDHVKTYLRKLFPW